MTNWQIREKNHPKTVLTDALELYIIELPKFDAMGALFSIIPRMFRLGFESSLNKEVSSFVKEIDAKEVDVFSIICLETELL